jgi:inhibitor of cysteine peptidase
MILRPILSGALLAALLVPGAPSIAQAAATPPPSATPAPAATPPAFVVVSDPSVPATVGEGAYFVVALAANVTTGYSWSFAGATPPTAVVSVGASYLGPSLGSPSPGTPPVVGAGGTALMLFHAVQSGSVTLNFAYARPWEKGVAPASTATFIVVVK